MSRRYRKTPADHLLEDLVKTASLIPWWITLPVALLLFVSIPYGLPAETNLQEPSDAIAVILGIFLKGFFKYVVPMALVFGAIINIYTALKSGLLFKSIRKNGAHRTVERLSWQDFEFLLSQWFKKQGHSTEITGGGGADGGVDIKVYKDNDLYLVQSKHYKSWKVPVNVVRELYGVMTAEKATGGYIVTSGKFTKDAEEFAKGKNIDLINGSQLEAVLDSAQEDETDTPETENDVCPKCGRELVERTGKYGKFIGCSNYPKCRYTEKLN